MTRIYLTTPHTCDDAISPRVRVVPARRDVVRAGLGLIATSTLGKNALADTWTSSLIAFATDLSSPNDTELMRQVANFATSPPTTREEIGFYGLENAAPRTRAFLATVSLLTERGYIQSVEDKYTYDILGEWQRDKLIDVDALPVAGRGVFGPIAKMDFPENKKKNEDYSRFVWENYGQATRELEQQIALSGRLLMSVDATSGDTLYFVVIKPEIAERWQDRAFSNEAGYQAGLRPAMWDRFFDHLDNALPGLLYTPERSGLPPGTPTRKADLPMI